MNEDRDHRQMVVNDGTRPKQFALALVNREVTWISN